MPFVHVHIVKVVKSDGRSAKAEDHKRVGKLKSGTTKNRAKHSGRERINNQLSSI